MLWDNALQEDFWHLPFAVLVMCILFGVRSRYCIPRGSLVVPFCGSYLRSYQVFQNGTTMEPIGPRYGHLPYILSDHVIRLADSH